MEWLEKADTSQLKIFLIAIFLLFHVLYIEARKHGASNIELEKIEHLVQIVLSTFRSDHFIICSLSIVIKYAKCLAIHRGTISYIYYIVKGP